MIINKTLGYLLLTVGLILIGWTLWQSYNIFTAKTEAPLVFKTQSELAAGNSNRFDVAEQINKVVQSQLNQIIPPATITKILNLTAWSLLAFILITAGGAVSKIGVKLINGKS